MNEAKRLQQNCEMDCTLSALFFFCKSYYGPLQEVFAYTVECRTTEGRFSLVPNSCVLETIL